MKFINVFMSIIALSLFVSGPAAASEQEDQWYVSGLATYIDPDSNRDLDDGVSGGQFNIGRAITEHFNVELEYDLLDVDGDNSGDPDTDLNAWAVNGMYVFNRENGFSPYLLAGAGMMKSDPDDSSSSTDFQAQVGPGFLWDLWEDRLALRTEAIGRFGDSKSDLLINAGLQYAFGGAAAAPVAAGPFDTDGDGVYDDKDQCPNTPPNTAVDKVGCAIPIDNDTDNDGVTNDIDECPDSPPRSIVNDVGCRYRVLGVLFAFDSAELTSDDISDLNEVTTVMKDREGLSIIVEGHTDSRGDDNYNMGLSERRADSVKAYLVGRGINGNRISTVGKGETEPVETNDTDKGRAANRRVELRVDEERSR